MTNVTQKRRCEWLDYGQFRFSFSQWQWHSPSDDFVPLMRISDRQGRAALYLSFEGGYHLFGFALGCEPLLLNHISVNVFDRLQIDNELIEAKEQRCSQATMC